MIWLRLLIAVIALTISSDLSAWGQPQKQINRNKRGRTISSAPLASAAPQVSAPSASTQPQQMQVNSPEGFYDCNGIANGANERDPVNDCCFRSQMNFCGRCRDNRSPCEKQSDKWCGTGATNPDQRCGCGLPGLVQVCGVCGYSMRGCESQRGCGNIDTVCGRCGPMQGCESVRGCGNIDTVCGSCTGTMGGCGRCEGCHSCSFNWGCQDAGTGCNPAYSDPSQACPGSGSIGHGATITKIIHTSFQRGTGYLWSTNVGAEQLSCFTQSFQTYTCNDGTLQ